MPCAALNLPGTVPNLLALNRTANVQGLVQVAGTNTVTFTSASPTLAP
jgi:hypothetical protein